MSKNLFIGTIFLLLSAFGLIIFLEGCSDPTCPAFTTLTITCGNGICEPRENEQSCAIDCVNPNNRVYSYYYLSNVCDSSRTWLPENIHEAQEAVRQIVSEGHRVRIVGARHTGTAAICPGENGEAIYTDRLKYISGIELFEGSETVEIDAGVTFWELQSYLHRMGYSHGFAAPGYGGITVSGGLAMGLHGSAVNEPSSISHYVVGLDVIGPDGELRTYTAGTTGITDPDLWKGLRANLGLLGFVARIRLKVQPQFNLHTTASYHDFHEVIDRGMSNFVHGCDHVFINWFPDIDRVVRTCATRTTDPADPNAASDLLIPQANAFEKFIFASQLQASHCIDDLACITERLSYDRTTSFPHIVTYTDDGKRIPGTSRIGYSHRMISIEKFPRDFPSFANIDWEVAVPESEIDELLRYADEVLEEAGQCMPVIGAVMRYDQATNDTFMGGNASYSRLVPGERMVHLEFPVYLPYHFDEERLADDMQPYVQIMLHAVEHHRGRLHWGKNQQNLFEEEIVMERNERVRLMFQGLIDRVDPYGVFANEFWDDVGFTWPRYGEDFSSVYD